MAICDVLFFYPQTYLTHVHFISSVSKDARWFQKAGKTKKTNQGPFNLHPTQHLAKKGLKADYKGMALLSSNLPKMYLD